MTTGEMLAIVQDQLAIDLNCTVEQLNGEPGSFVFVEAKDNPGWRPFQRRSQHFEMLTMGGSIVVSATPARLAYVKDQFAGNTRDEAFAMPFIRGLSFCFLPDIGRMEPIPPPSGFTYEIFERGELAPLLKLQDFDNALQCDPEHPIPNTLVMTAKQGNAVVAMAGAFAWSERMWAIGIDTLPAFRGQGLAAYLVSALTFETLQRGIVPVYSSDASNIASQRVACRVGYYPAWISDRGVRFEGELSN